MKLLIQRVEKASVEVDKQIISQIDFGYLGLLGIAEGDTLEQADWLIDKMLKIRLFEDQYNKMNLSLEDVGGDILIVSQFTLYGNCEKGRRPSFIHAMKPGPAEDMYNNFVQRLQEAYTGGKIATGKFGAHMNVSLVNDGPVTIMLEK